MTDTPITAHPLSAAWLAFGRRLAVAGGSLAALVALFFHAPVWVASLRGALAWIALRVIVRICAHAQLASIGPEPPPQSPVISHEPKRRP